MSEKVRNYTKHSIEICRNCHGAGVTFETAEAIGNHTAEPETCNVCRGSGRVDKELQIPTTIRPHI